jgi:Fur family iron response transcriptional regulator
MPWPSLDLAERLRSAGLRITRPRLALARLLCDGGHRHVTAEKLHGEAIAAAIPVSLATVYNTLHQFTTAGLLREVVIAPGRSYFDTNIDAHHHFFCESTGMLQDIAGQGVVVSGLPAPPAGTEISHVEVIVRLRARD